MGLYNILLKVDGEGIDIIYIPNESYEWIINAKCVCGTIHECLFTEEDQIDNQTKTSSHNFFKKCKDCKHEISLSIVEKSRSKVKCNNKKFQKLVTIDCRGCTPESWIPRPGLAVMTEDEIVYQDVELNEDWAEYDEKSQTSLMISSYEIKFERK